ncbi:MAG: hypothetical protein GY861_14275 [bacterium]|nr:hypothetical protein [bacterium]
MRKMKRMKGMKVGILFVILIMLIGTAEAGCIKSGTITKMIETEDNLVVVIEGKEYVTLNASKLKPGDYAQVYENNQGNYYLRKVGRPTGTVLKTEILKDKTLIRLSNGNSYYVDGFVPILPGAKVKVLLDCEGKYKAVILK